MLFTDIHYPERRRGGGGRGGGERVEWKSVQYVVLVYEIFAVRFLPFFIILLASAESTDTVQSRFLN